MKKAILAVLSIFTIPSCSDVKNHTTETVNVSTIVTKEEQMEHKVDSLKLRGLCDSSRWAIYALNSDSIVVFKNKTSDSINISYASLDLRLDTFSINEDTIEFMFRYYYKGQVCDGHLVSNPLYRGIRYTNSIERNYKMCYVNRPIYFCPGDPNSRYLNMAHPEVIAYINENRKDLNNWFKAEAIRRGLLKSE